VPAHLEEYDLDDWDLAHTSGIRILGNYPVDNQPGPNCSMLLSH
jgi:hypothetical protein